MHNMTYIHTYMRKAVILIRRSVLFISGKRAATSERANIIDAYICTLRVLTERLNS